MIVHEKSVNRYEVRDGGKRYTVSYRCGWKCDCMRGRKRVKSSYICKHIQVLLRNKFPGLDPDD